MKNGSFAAYFSEKVFFLKINSDTRSISPLIKINFQINKGQMTVNKVCASLSPKLIVIALVSEQNDFSCVGYRKELRSV